MTDFRAVGTIMGLAGLTAVFGMGTGGTPPVWSPEKRPAGGEAAPVAVCGSASSAVITPRQGVVEAVAPPHGPDKRGSRKRLGTILVNARDPWLRHYSERIGVVKHIGC